MQSGSPTWQPVRLSLLAWPCLATWRGLYGCLRWRAALACERVSMVQPATVASSRRFVYFRYVALTALSPSAVLSPSPVMGEAEEQVPGEFLFQGCDGDSLPLRRSSAFASQWCPRMAGFLSAPSLLSLSLHLDPSYLAGTGRTSRSASSSGDFHLEPT